METKTIYELFSTLPQERIVEVLHKYIVDVPETFCFSRVNIIIGSNGSGKTRFLKALKDLYIQQHEGSVIYGYFPALSDKQIKIEEEDEPPVTLFESINSGEISFDDFFCEIERHNTEFIQELLLYRSRRRTEIQSLVAESFCVLTGKALVFREKQAYVQETNGDLELLSVVLGRLSPGELMLFYMSIFLALRKDGAKGKTIILDEPECHLHPKALQAFVELLTKQYNHGTIWIATHSLFLVPTFEFENIVYIENSKVQPRSSIMYQSILDGLLGSDKSVEEFFSSVSQWQFCKFIAECFTNPTVVDTIDPNDEQVQIFIRQLNENKPMRVLDWGGGSARLGKSLLAAGYKHGVDFDYKIYDTKPTYSGEEFDCFNRLEEIKGTYHCIVMMNFLHEVEPGAWQETFACASNLLEDDGFLLFVEVKVLCDGEMPNGVGYLLLGPEEIQQLFRGENTYRVNIEKKSIGVIVPKKVLTTITNDSINHAIKYLEQRTLCEIKEFRASKESPMDLMHTRASTKPRHYAFLLQQYINAMLFNEGKEENSQDLSDFLENVIKENDKLESKSKHLESVAAKVKAENKTLELENRRLKLELICNKLKFEYTGDDPKIEESIFQLSRAVDYFCKRGYISRTLRRALAQSIKVLNSNEENQELLCYFKDASSLLGIE